MTDTLDPSSLTPDDFEGLTPPSPSASLSAPIDPLNPATQPVQSLQPVAISAADPATINPLSITTAVELERPVGFFPTVDNLIGGGPSKLDGLTTNEVSPNSLVAVAVGTQLLLYRLIPGDHPNIPPKFVNMASAPDDYSFLLQNTLSTEKMELNGEINKQIGNTDIGKTYIFLGAENGIWTLPADVNNYDQFHMRIYNFSGFEVFINPNGAVELNGNPSAAISIRGGSLADIWADGSRFLMFVTRSDGLQGAIDGSKLDVATYRRGAVRLLPDIVQTLGGGIASLDAQPSADWAERDQAVIMIGNERRTYQVLSGAIAEDGIVTIQFDDDANKFWRLVSREEIDAAGNIVQAFLVQVGSTKGTPPLRGLEFRTNGNDLIADVNIGGVVRTLNLGTTTL